MMKRARLKWMLVASLIFLVSCRNETIKLISKKWDCVNVENLLPPGQLMRTAQDSSNVMQMQNLVGSLSWTFNEELEYSCSVSGRVLVRGTYQLMGDDKVLVCTPSTKNNINRYVIHSLNENELVLKSNANNTAVVLYFKPN
jgi:hypothetical protein